MLNSHRKQRQVSSDFDSSEAVSPRRRTFNNNRSPYRESDTYYTGLIRRTSKSPASRYCQNEFSDYFARSPVKNRTPTGNRSPIRSRTPNRERSPIRLRTPVKTPKKELNIKYIPAKNNFQKNPQSVTSNYVTSGNALINAQSQQKNKPAERLFDKLLAQMNSDHKDKENKRNKTDFSNKWTVKNDIDIYSKQTSIDRKAGTEKTSFSALIQQISQIESVQYVQSQAQKPMECEKKSSAKTTTRTTNTFQKNLNLLNERTTSPMAKVRKNMNSHREINAKTRMVKRVSQCVQQTPHQAFKYYSCHPHEENSSPHSNLHSPSQRLSMKQSRKPSLFEEIVLSFDGRNEDKIIEEATRHGKQNEECFNNQDISMKKQSSALHHQRAQQPKPRTPEVVDSVELVLRKISERCIKQESISEERIEVKNSMGGNESLNMDAFL